MAKASAGAVVRQIIPFVALLIAFGGALTTRRAWHHANEARAYWTELHDQDEARIEAISAAVVKSNDRRAAAIDDGMKNSQSVIILGEDNRGLDGTVSAIFENDQLVLIKVSSGSGDSEVTIHYYLENERDPLVVAHTEVKRDGSAPHQETYRWYFAGGEYVTFRFSNPDEEEKFSPRDRPEDIANIQSKIAHYLELLDLLGIKKSKATASHGA